MVSTSLIVEVGVEFSPDLQAGCFLFNPSGRSALLVERGVRQARPSGLISLREPQLVHCAEQELIPWRQGNLVQSEEEAD
jgi:hypothetical protein